MHLTDLPEELAFAVRLAAVWYGKSPSAFVRDVVQTRIGGHGGHHV
jgi:hypothetical protein